MQRVQGRPTHASPALETATFLPLWLTMTAVWQVGVEASPGKGWFGASRAEPLKRRDHRPRGSSGQQQNRLSWGKPVTAPGASAACWKGCLFPRPWSLMTLAGAKAWARGTRIQLWHSHVTEHFRACLLSYSESLEGLPHLVASALNTRPGVGVGDADVSGFSLVGSSVPGLPPVAMASLGGK